jgi:hydroxymethyl cephem carbamoyltransferase
LTLPAHHAAALITDRIYDEFAAVARRVADRHAPLVISGGCGLNCDWNERWRMSALFSGVFVPPCANDSGSAIGTAIDAQRHFGGEARLTWSVYSGDEFSVDEEPDAGTWERARLDVNEVCLRLATGEVVAWVPAFQRSIDTVHYIQIAR